MLHVQSQPIRASLVPTLAFGENDLYELYSANQKSKTYKMQQLLKRVVGFTAPIFNGRGVFNCKVLHDLSQALVSKADKKCDRN